MDREQLRAVQAPIDERPRDDPATARITLVAEGRLARRCRVVLQTLTNPPSLAVSRSRPRTRR